MMNLQKTLYHGAGSRSADGSILLVITSTSASVVERHTFAALITMSRVMLAVLISPS